MRLIGLAVILSLGLILAPLAAEGQSAGKVYRIGVLSAEVLPGGVPLPVENPGRSFR